MRGLEIIKEGGGDSSDDNEGESTTPPVMHTFFEPVPGGCCGASEEGHQKLLQAWESSWRESGWETRILTIDDAKKHKDFDRMSEIMERFKVGEYNRRCFYRWLAMAEIGGFMADYDTFPLDLNAEVGSKFINGDGEFTSLSSVVPALIHANKEEWERIMHVMMELLESRQDDEEGIITDNVMLGKVKKHLGLFKAGRFAPPGSVVVPGLPYVYEEIEDENDRKLKCDALKNKLAIHFSHKSTDEAFRYGTFPIKSDINSLEDAMERRSSAALIMLNDRKRQCPDDHLEEII